MLDLQEAAARRTGPTDVSCANQLNTGASLHFDRVIGSIGESLGPSLDGVESDVASKEAA